MKNETKEPVIEVGMVFKSTKGCIYKVVSVDYELNEVKTVDVDTEKDLKPFSWRYDGYVHRINIWWFELIETDDPVKTLLESALEEIEALKEKLAAYKEALESSRRVIQSFQTSMDKKDPLTPYRPSRLDFFTAAALTGLSGGVNSCEQDAEHAVEGARALIAELDKEAK